MPVRFALRLVKHGAVWLYRLVALAVLTCAVTFFRAVLVLRYWILPNIDAYRPLIVQALTHATNQRIDIGYIAR
jgi:uncharacterized protein YhdP